MARSLRSSERKTRAPGASNVRLGRDAREWLGRGVDTAGRVVGATFGPRGQTVAFTRALRSPQVSSDGATVADELCGAGNPFLDLGFKLMREAASRASAAAGDGTTTATLLAQAMVREGLDRVAAGAQPMAMRIGLRTAAKAAAKAIKAQACEIRGQTDLAHVAAVASGDVELGEKTAEMAARLGRDGLITVDFHRRGQRLEQAFVDGMQIDRGWISPYFVSDPRKRQGELENPRVILSDQDLSAAGELAPLLDRVAGSGNRHLLVVANTVKGGALQLLLHNKQQGVLDVLAIQAPGFGEEMRESLEDVAVLTGATVISDDLGVPWREVPLDLLGECRRVVTSEEATLIMEGQGREAEVRDRMAQLREQLVREPDRHRRRKLQRRVAGLGGAVGVIRVGGVTEQERRALKERAENAVAAVRTAVRTGVVPGGGTALLRAQPAVAACAASLPYESALGARVMETALEAPLRRLAGSAGVSPSVVVSRVRAEQGWHGWDALTDEYVDLRDRGILDPAGAAIGAIGAAASVGELVMSTEAIVCEPRRVPRPRKPVDALAGWHGPG